MKIRVFVRSHVGRTRLSNYVDIARRIIEIQEIKWSVSVCCFWAVTLFARTLPSSSGTACQSFDWVCGLLDWVDLRLLIDFVSHREVALRIVLSAAWRNVRIGFARGRFY